jgi:hypothetical protein
MKTQPTTGKLNPVSTNPNSKPAHHFAELFSNKPIILITVFISVLILSTSFQSGSNEMVHIESEYLIPDLINGLKTTLSENGGQSQAGTNTESIVLYNQVRQFYMLHAYRPAWTSFNHLNRNGESLVCLIENAREYGLEPVHYHIDKLREIRLKIEDEGNRSQHGQNRMELEMLLTDAALKLMVNLHGGYRAFDSTFPPFCYRGSGRESRLNKFYQFSPGLLNIHNCRRRL